MIAQQLSAAVISQWHKDFMRNKLKTVKKSLDEIDRARKTVIYQKASLVLYVGLLLIGWVFLYRFFHF